MTIPSVGTPIGFKDILNGLFAKRSREGFAKTIASQTERKYCLLTNSGTAAYFLILKALQRLSGKREVILPAYTAPSLILPIKQAGLIPRLCDIDLKTFNMDLTALSKVVNDDTLAITIVHMFGLPMWFKSAAQVKAMSNDAFLIEDLASAQGSMLYGRIAGSFGDVSFVSFNRGKNFATLSGGAIATDREDIYGLVLEQGKRYLQEPALTTRIGIAFKAIALSLAVRPWFYTIFRGLIAPFKYHGIHDSFAIHAYTRFQAGMGSSAFQKAAIIFERRAQNGLYLLRALSEVKGITIPTIPDGAIPAFNQFPLLVEGPSLRDRIVRALVNGGIEATTLYPEPIHRVYDLGYDLSNDPFPHATYLSTRLILIPTQPYVTEKYLKKAVDIMTRHL
ncbi:MAG: DegT/DnrJ/EryC1/StrS family aminotransferase [Deltaproteobacteria bacterium]|nr:DegT/DnrJ/EryC1/StrS family aminotransferase [Deltaproteobacteria bacterium]